ncbi:unnamed protein product [Bursaphelenchus okinawaensis]|uniref:Uncharacterized protein n=1 Tax=Bursaphelenchus okinawaensis TaxID=465554 RepID=A0A811LF99_9BILA|nr:unnamed protein product [Bursaphelenchus okinawaensis]CAG9121354.1 unnamed protein product [Bursaphelenchus okinawaensis]
MVAVDAQYLLNLVTLFVVILDHVTALNYDSYEDTRIKRRERWREQHPQIRNGHMNIRAFWWLYLVLIVVVVI